MPFPSTRLSCPMRLVMLINPINAEVILLGFPAARMALVPVIRLVITMPLLRPRGLARILASLILLLQAVVALLRACRLCHREFRRKMVGDGTSKLTRPRQSTARCEPCSRQPFVFHEQRPAATWVAAP